MPVGNLGSRPSRTSLGFAVYLDGSIELGTHDHSRGAKYALWVMTHRDRLLRRGFSAANQVLLLAFDPEVRRTVCEVGQNCDHRRFGPSIHRVGLSQPLQNRVIEVGDHRDHKLWPRPLPVARQQPDDRRLELPNQHLRYPQQRAGADGKTVLELRVVEILDANTREAPNHVGRFEQLAQVDRIDIPRTMLLAGRRYQCRRRSAMSTARVEIDQIDS